MTKPQKYDTIKMRRGREINTDLQEKGKEPMMNAEEIKTRINKLNKEIWDIEDKDRWTMADRRRYEELTTERNRMRIALNKLEG